MKYLLSAMCILFFSINCSSQRSYTLRADAGSLNLENNLLFSGLSVGFDLKSKWISQYSYERGSRITPDLPMDYQGKKLYESLSFHSVTVGRILPLNKSKKLTLISNLGIHFGQYESPTNFKSKSQSTSELWNAVQDLVSSSTHNYDIEKENLIGISSELLLEYKFNKWFAMSIGPKYIKNDRYNSLGYGLKLGIRI